MLTTTDSFSIDPYSPADMALRAESMGVNKARLGVGHTLALAMLGGAFIALGAMFSSVVGLDSNMGYGVTRLLVGISFSLGLILVVVGGAELFTGNNLIVMAWATANFRLPQSQGTGRWFTWETWSVQWRRHSA
jgi:formate transporter